MTTLPNMCTWGEHRSVWPPLPPTPPPADAKWVSRRVMIRKCEEAQRTKPAWLRVQCVFKAPTLAPLDDCRIGGGGTWPAEIPPGSPWARSTGKAWELDESPTRFCPESIVGQVRLWHSNGTELSAQAQSSLGIDPFLYQVNGMLYPPPERFDALKARLVELAIRQPDELHRAVHFEQLAELLGREYAWVRLPKTKTHGDNADPLPW